MSKHWLDKWAEVAGKLVEKLPFHKLDQVGVVIVFFAILLAGMTIAAFYALPADLAFKIFSWSLSFLALMFMAFIISKRF
jgi:hypothetical protein